MTREEKIKFLKDLASGKVSDLPKSLEDREVWFVDSGMATNERTGETITEDELDSRNKGLTPIVFK